jgi:hypothetical protein
MDFYEALAQYEEKFGEKKSFKIKKKKNIKELLIYHIKNII